MKIDITDKVDNYTITILREEDAQEVYLVVSLTTSTGKTFTPVDKMFKNSLLASAMLRDHLGLGPALDLLDKHDIPRQDAMFDLNHSGYRGRERVIAEQSSNDL